jgi:hemerythrin superfamily protein
MATSPHTEHAKSTAKQTRSGQDAIALLKADHREVKGWFGEYEKARSDKRKTELSTKICMALKVHTQIEEEYFYPAARDVLTDKKEEMVDEAVVEHQAAKELIAEIEAMTVGDELYDAKVKVLSEQIEHHVQEEEKELFPAVKKTDLDLKSLGAQLAARKTELMGQLGGESAH